MAPRLARPPAPAVGTYADLSTRPLHILVFLLPLIVAYEVGSVVFLTDASGGVAQTIRARSILAGFFEVFGVAGIFLPGLAMVTVLGVWHVLRGDPARVRPRVVGAMALESAAWALPLVVMAHLVMLLGGPLAGMPSESLWAMPGMQRLVIAIGAGLYEELLFRMVALAALHALLVDLCRTSEWTGRWLAVLFSALAFAVYHDLSGGAAGVEWRRAVFFFASGVYLGALYLGRGFGIVVGVHAVYDVLVLQPWA